MASSGNRPKISAKVSKGKDCQLNYKRGFCKAAPGLFWTSHSKSGPRGVRSKAKGPPKCINNGENRGQTMAAALLMFWIFPCGHPAFKVSLNSRMKRQLCVTEFGVFKPLCFWGPPRGPLSLSLSLISMMFVFILSSSSPSSWRDPEESGELHGEHKSSVKNSCTLQFKLFISKGHQESGSI